MHGERAAGQRFRHVRVRIRELRSAHFQITAGHLRRHIVSKVKHIRKRHFQTPENENCFSAYYTPLRAKKKYKAHISKYV